MNKLSKGEKILDREWQDSHILKIKNRAENRYTPELNVNLPISHIFDGLSRTEKFYSSIRKHYGVLSRKFAYVSQEYNNQEIQGIYDILKKEISELFTYLSVLKQYNTEQIPWGEINKQTEKISDILMELSSKLRQEQSEVDGLSSDRFSSDIHYLYETQKEIRYFKELSSSSKAQVSNCPFLLLTGPSGTGKTHLLCDIVSTKLFPAVLVFGEFFSTNEEPFIQIIRQLRLQINKQQLLEQLNVLAEQLNTRAVIAIDALNETRRQNFWKANLNKVVSEIKKYPNIGLVISIRTGFEKEIISKNLKNTFVHKKHQGFRFKEWEAVTKFFNEFQLPLPEIPLLTLEFQNPLFLLLFCKAFQKRKKQNNTNKPKQVFKGHEGATYIFESFVDSVSKRISKQFNIPSNKGNSIWDTIIKNIAAEMVKQNNDRVTEKQIVDLIKIAYPSISHSDFLMALEKNLLIVKSPRYSKEKNDYDGFDFRFSFQKFSDHLIGRYLFKNYEQEFGISNKNLHTAKKFFSKHRKIGKFLTKQQNRGIVEALSIQCPEHLKGYELIEVTPYLKDSYIASEAFLESLIWRKPEAFPKKINHTLSLIKKIKRLSYYDLFNTVLTVAPVEEHPFNAEFLHNSLSKFSMAKRDSWWSTLLHKQYGEKGAVDRLIEWGWSHQDKRHIDKNVVYLYSIALSWFLTTPNRFVRDKATKVLVTLLTNRLDIVLDLLKKFKTVNDPYITERLHAITYGCAIRSEKNNKVLKILSQWVYDEIFKLGSPPVHILIRDYARGVIEVASHRGIKLTFDRKKIEPPFSSSWIDKVPSKKILEKKYCSTSGGVLNIWHSVMYDSTTLADFGNYIVNFAVNHWSGRKLKSKKINRKTLFSNFKNKLIPDEYGNISNPSEFFDRSLAHRWIFNRVIQMGWKEELHGQFDEEMSYNWASRSEHKPERIGKKYQWIALYELLARIADNFEFKSKENSDQIGKYVGPWQISIRNIDPSCILKEFANEKTKDVPNFSTYNIQRHYNLWNEDITNLKWLKQSQDLPDPKKIIELIDDQKSVWVALEGFFEWQEETPPEEEKYSLPTRTLWYMLKSYIVRVNDKDKMFKWAKQQDFYGGWMPESHKFYRIYLGEYPWAPAFLYHNVPYYHHEEWTDRGRNGQLPSKILVTDDCYLSSGSSIDCSTEEAVKITLPAKFIVDKMNLIQKHMDGRFFDKNGDLVAFDPSVFYNNIPRQVLIRKDKLSYFLKSKNCALFWTILGEKNISGMMDRKTIPGRFEISGAYTLNNKSRVIGEYKSWFKKYNN